MYWKKLKRTIKAQKTLYSTHASKKQTREEFLLWNIDPKPKQTTKVAELSAKGIATNDGGT